MIEDTDWNTDWNPNVPRWVYCLPCEPMVAYNYAERSEWLGKIVWGNSSFVSNFTIEKLAEDSGLKFDGVEFRTCYDRDLDCITHSIIVWRDNVPETEEDRREVGKMVDYLKEKLGLDPSVEPKWRLYNYQYQLQNDEIDQVEKPESLVKFT